MRFTRTADTLVISDTWGRTTQATLAGELVTEVLDHTGRRWTYSYDGDLLTEVVRPATRDFPNGSTVLYNYDNQLQLKSVTDAAGRTYLENRFDTSGRVIEQRFGVGKTCLVYEDNGDGVRTTVRGAAGNITVLQHDLHGHLASRTVLVRRAALSPQGLPPGTDDPVPLVTTYVLNRHSEVVARTDPAGWTTRWTYTEDDPDPRNRGNLVRVVRTPQDGVASDQASLVTVVETERTFQRRTAITDPRGATVRYGHDDRGNRILTAYPSVTRQPVGGSAGARPASEVSTPTETTTRDAAGLPLRTTHADGTVTAFAYFPETDPTGQDREISVPTLTGRGGMLAAVTRDAEGRPRTTTFGYAPTGQQTHVTDPAGGTATLDRGPSGQIEQVSGRLPGHTLRRSHDVVGNVVTSTRTMTRYALDEVTAAVIPTTGEITERWVYDDLDRVVQRTIEGEDGQLSVSEQFERDAEGRVTRAVGPTGDVTEYRYDERGLMISRSVGAGTPAASTERFLWTPDGSLSEHWSARGARTRWSYDGFGRCTGITDASGTTRTWQLDAAGAIVRVLVTGPIDGPEQGPVEDTVIRRDEWGRPVRINRAWHDTEGQPLGRSDWDGEDGVVSTLVEYDAAGRLAAIWSEGEETAQLSWDGVDQLTGVRGPGAEEWKIDRDATGRPVVVSFHGSEAQGHRPLAVKVGFDAMGRPIRLQLADLPPESFTYDESGAVTEHSHTTGLRIQHLRDSLGRRTGQVVTIPDGRRSASPTSGHSGTDRLLLRYEYDAAYRLLAVTHGAGRHTRYDYDALGRQNSVTRPDGRTARVLRDDTGSTAEVVDENGTRTTVRFDAVGRLVSRLVTDSGSARQGVRHVESFRYDALGRLVAATSGGHTVRWTYDSLSRPLTEECGGQVVRAVHDAAGRTIALRYPGGLVVRREYDRAGRVVAVDTDTGDVVARVRYGDLGLVHRLELGGAVVATCDYDSACRLTGIDYRRIADNGLVQQFRYHYDAAGLPAGVVRVDAEGMSAEHYHYDAGGRPVLARYGITDTGLTSSFGSESRYEYLPEGTWARRVDRDGTGAVLSDQQADLDSRGRYRRFGDVEQRTDACGDVVRRTSSRGTFVYTYDGSRRLVLLECFDTAGARTFTVAYTYDALGRLLTRIFTDVAGDVTEHGYVWAGDVLLEEYENGVLVRTYIHSVGSLPALLRTQGPTRVDHVFVHDGRGLAAGLVALHGTNAFAERYGYEITGAAFLTEIAGVTVPLPDRGTTSSSLLNSVLSSTPGVLQDWTTGLMAGLGGKHLDPRIADALNITSQLTGTSHAGARDTISEQLGGMLSMLGLGGRPRPPTVLSGSGFGGGMSEYAAGSGAPSRSNPLIPPDRPPSNPAFDFSGRTAPPAATSPSFFQEVKDCFSKVVRIGPDGLLESTVGALAGGAAATLAFPQDHTKDMPPPGSTTSAGTGGPTKAEQNAQEAAERQKKEQADREAAEKAATEKAKVDADKQKSEEDAKKKEGEDAVEGGSYSDPDAATVTVPFLSADEVETMLNVCKHPVNPNFGANSGPNVDLSSPPARHGGLDPTVAYIDADGPLGGWAGGTGPIRLSIAPVDFVKGFEKPFFVPTDPDAGGDIGPCAFRP